MAKHEGAWDIPGASAYLTILQNKNNRSSLRIQYTSRRLKEEPGYLSRTWVIYMILFNSTTITMPVTTVIKMLLE